MSLTDFGVIAYGGHITVTSGTVMQEVVAQADQVGTDWTICRVLVRLPENRRKGYGRLALRKLVGQWNMVRQSNERLLVQPGGYNMPWLEQCAFYEACGFTPIGDGVYEYTGCLPPL
jgi:GNAT superfamily N-acetyltransferase